MYMNNIYVRELVSEKKEEEYGVIEREDRQREREREKNTQSLPFFHVLTNQEVVVPPPCLVGAITKVGSHMDPVPVVVVMDTTT